MVEISDVSTDMRSLRSKRVGPLTESEIPIEKKENQSRKVRHRAGHGYEDGAISNQLNEPLKTVTQRQGVGVLCWWRVQRADEGESADQERTRQCAHHVGN